MGNLQSPIDIRDRVFFSVDGASSGPCLIFVCGIHGNEAMPVRAAYAIADELRELAPRINGKLVFALGNIPALQKGVRFIDCDLNRLWTADEWAQVKEALPLNCPNELIERRQLIEHLTPDLMQSERKVYCVDLHTFSAPGPAFMIPLMGDSTMATLADSFQIPAVFGVAESLGGHFVESVHQLGHIACGIEIGQHDDLQAVQSTRAIISLMLKALGLVSDEIFQKLRTVESEQCLRQTSTPCAGKYQLVQNYMFETEGEFAMESGYSSFDRVEQGELLGRDSKGEVRAAVGGYILMPLYQKRGLCGFSIVERI